jgi:hypothetical protein
MGAAMVISGLLLLPIAVPLLPVTALHSAEIRKINYDMGETVGWPRLVALVAREYRALPPALRDRTAILARNYGEAGAIDRYGPADGLPQAYSGHNNFWLWGPPPARDTSVLAVDPDLSVLRREFAAVRRVATYYNGLGIEDDEQGAPLYLATGLRSPWTEAWPQFRDYS